MYIGIIGIGKVGTTLAQLWYDAGYDITAVYNRNTISAQMLAGKIASTCMESVDAVIEAADLIMLSVSDDAIAAIVEVITISDLRGKAFVHNSGAYDTGVLRPLAVRGAAVGSLHPAFPFADVGMALKTLPGATFAIEADQLQLLQWLRELVTVLDGYCIEIPVGQKSAYHAALVIASNYTVTLYAAAQRVLNSMCDDLDAVNNALDTLMTATIKNLSQHGIPNALTGPLTRADAGTIHAHIEAIKDDPVLLHAYQSLAMLTVPVLEARGVSPNFINGLETTLDEQEDAFDDTRYTEDEG